MSSTTLTSWALLLWNTLKERGYDPRPIFEKAGADPSKLGDGQARYSVDLMPKLWDAAIEQTGDEDIGVAVGKSWNPTTFHALGFAWLASSSLLEGFQRLTRYAHIVNNSLIVNFEPKGANYRFSLSTSRELVKKHPAGSDAGIAAILQMCRLLVGNDFSPIAMELIRPHRSPSAIEAFAGITPEYSSQENVLIFDAKVMTTNLATANASLVTANEQVARDYLRWLNKNDVVSSVRAKIVELLPSGTLNEKRIAQSVNMNVRTMQRKLKDRNQTFKEIVNSTRQEIVQSYIRNSQLSLTEIAYLLGFSDQANFTRAFKRWNGVSPSEQRKVLEKKMANI